MTGFRQILFSGASWMLAVRGLDRAIGFGSIMVLVRLLGPHDFGLVAMATSILGLLEMLSAFGFDVALIRQTSADRGHYDTAWTFNVLVGVTVAMVLALLAFPAARFYGEPRVAYLMLALAAAPIFQGLENIGVVAFRKELNFRGEFMWLTGKRLVGLVTVLPLAFALRNYWALVAGIVVSRVAGVVLSYLAHPYRPRFSLSRRQELLGFSKWVVTVNILGFLVQRSSDLVVGRTLGPAPLGVFTISAEVASLPTTELVAPINRAVYPAFTRIAHDRPRLKDEYLAAMGMIALVVLPAAMVVAAVAGPLVLLLLGEKWLTAVPLIQIFAVLGAVQFPYTNAYAIFLAVGRPDHQVKVHACHVPVLVGLMIVLAHWYGVIGAAWATVVTGCLVVPMSLSLVFRELDIRVREFLAVVWRPGTAAASMYAVMTTAGPTAVPAGAVAAALQLIALVAGGMAIYVVVVLALWRSVGAPLAAEGRVLDLARTVLRGWWTRQPVAR
jgi:lipopolysaccharide exporter